MAAQRYFLENSKDMDNKKIETFLSNWMPKESLKEHDVSYWRELLRKSLDTEFQDGKTNKESLKCDIVTFAKDKWFQLFSRFYDVQKLTGPSGSWQNIIVGLNSKGVHIMDEAENVKNHLSYIEIAKVSRARYTSYHYKHCSSYLYVLYFLKSENILKVSFQNLND